MRLSGIMFLEWIIGNSINSDYKVQLGTPNSENACLLQRINTCMHNCTYHFINLFIYRLVLQIFISSQYKLRNWTTRYKSIQLSSSCPDINIVSTLWVNTMTTKTECSVAPLNGTREDGMNMAFECNSSWKTATIPH